MKLPGFRWNPRTRVARFEAIIPGTDSHVRKRTTVEAATRDEALEKWKRFRDAAVVEKEPWRGAPRFAAYVDRFRPALSERVSAGRAKIESAYLDKHLLPFFGTYPLDKINLALVRDFVALKTKEGYAAPTVNSLLALLRKYLRDALEREEIPSYPIHGKLPKRRETPLRAELSDDERAAFLNAFDDEAAFVEELASERVRQFGSHRVRPDSAAGRYYYERFAAAKPLFVLALETGLSRTDLFGLTWDQIREGVIYGRRHKTGVESVIPLSPAAVTALRQLLEQRPAGWVTRHVFLDHEGKRFAWATMLRYFALAKKLAGITRRVRFHDLRHTFASRLASKGVSLQIIARALGHASTRMSERYARPSEESLVAIRLALSDETNSAANAEPPVQERPKLQVIEGSGAGHGGRTRDIYLGKSPGTLEPSRDVPGATSGPGGAAVSGRLQPSLFPETNSGRTPPDDEGG